MRVIRVRECGPPEVLRVEEAERPVPSPGQVLVAVEVAGVVYGDTIVRAGRFPFPIPYVPGLEVGGRVIAAGPDVGSSLVGRRVVATTPGRTGGYAELALAEAASVYGVPDGLPLDRAVAVFQAGAVAAGVLAAMRVRAGDTVLVTAAAGRVGSLLVQLAKAAGARVIGAAGGEEKAAAASAFGADVAVDYRQAGWVARVRAATGGRGASVVLDAVGGTIGGQAIEAAADGAGRIGLYGLASGSWTTIGTPELSRRGLTVTGALGVALASPAAEQRAQAEQALAAAATGRLVPRIHAAHPLEQAARAHADLEGRATIGALVLVP